MQKLYAAVCILCFSAIASRVSAQTGGFQQLSFTAGAGSFGRIIPSVPVKAGPAYSGSFNWGFYAVPHLFVDFGIAVFSFHESYRATDYGSPTGGVATFKQKLFMLSHMAGAGVCLGNRNLHVLLGAHATLNLMYPENNAHYIAAHRDLRVGVAPHAAISFRAGKRLLLGVSGQAMFFPGFNKEETGLAGSYIGGGIHVQRAN